MILPKLGIDQSKSWFDVCLLCGKKPKKKRFSNDEKGFRALSEWLVLQDVERVHASMEATGRYGNKLAKHMHEEGHKVSVVNPRWVHDHRDAMGKRNKTDSEDSFVNADYARCHEPSAWTPKNSLCTELDDAFGEMNLIKKTLVAFKNRGQCGLESAEVKQVNTLIIADLERHLSVLVKRAKEIVSADQQLQTNYKILVSIPGIGQETAFGLLAKVDFDQFTNGRSLAAFLGVTSKEWQSGTKKRKGQQTKEGNGTLRALLHMGAVATTYRFPAYIEFAERLRKKGLKEGQIINAVARKMVLIAHALFRKGQLFDPCYVHPLASSAKALIA